ncbi:MAG: hypothetical protein Q4C77_12035 [Eubacteriales bacterium]|nr:hypothetical protein [Eubacteriales bacterium]
MENNTGKYPDIKFENAEIAELPEACLKRIHEFERELNKEGFWNIALVAYQMKN